MCRFEGPFGESLRGLRQRLSSLQAGLGAPAGRSGRHRLTGFLRDRKGAVAAMTAVSLVVILGMGAFAIDMSYAYATRNLLQVTASSAALAAAPELPDQGQAIAKALEYTEENMPAANHGAVLENSDVVFGNWNPSTETWTPGGAPVNAVEVTARRSTDNDNRLELFLSPILNLGFLDMEASAVAYSKAPTAWDVVIVQDVTGTFTEEIGDARDADQVMLDCVANHFVDSRMGLTIFNGTARIRTPMLPVGLPGNRTNYDIMKDAIYNLEACDGPPADPPMPICTGTHVGIGIERAIDQLDSYVPSDGIVGQAIVIVGDGIPNARSNAQSFYPESRYYDRRCRGGDCNDKMLERMAEDAAAEAEGKGYDIYVLYYEEDYDPARKAAKFFEKLVTGNGKFRETPNSDELDEMMFELCNSLRDLELVM